MFLEAGGLRLTAAVVFPAILVSGAFEVEFVLSHEDAFDLLLVPCLIGDLVLQPDLQPDFAQCGGLQKPLRIVCVELNRSAVGRVSLLG